MEFYYLVIGVSLCSLELDLVKICLARKYLGFSAIRICKNSTLPVFSSFIACIFAILVRSYFDNLWGVVLAGIVFLLLYIAVVSISKESRILLCGGYRKMLCVSFGDKKL